MGYQEALSCLDDDILLELAVQLRERWEDVFRNGLTVAEKSSSDASSCLPMEQIQYCRYLAPREPVIQAFHALARWRWFCWYVGCTDRKALNALVSACRSAGVRLSDKLEQLNLISASLDYV
ncbi:unnamed protein product [Echinostoma caproni]|uniref:DUF772 domain-containing protein n=1 Tax=Echinostoma caproni TaxID=27848 RepID=A0A183AC46_9TREM|nr:unnamed protein product [Echinostoma caproni]